jgi:ribosomal protein L28
LHHKKQLAREHRDVPEYPHGPARLYKKSNFGLYGAARVRFGNIVSKGKWVKKTRRKWWPNVQESRLWSEGLKKNVELKVTTSVLRTIDKVGGLDNYLLGSTSQRIKDLGMRGWKLRWDLMQQPSIVERFANEREQLGLKFEAALESQKEIVALKTEFKEAYAVKPVEERSKAYFEKRRRKDVWGAQILPFYNDVVREAWEKLRKAPITSEVAHDEFDGHDHDREILATEAKHDDVETLQRPDIPQWEKLEHQRVINAKLEEDPDLWQDIRDDITNRLQASKA